jgi:transposase-like protein
LEVLPELIRVPINEVMRLEREQYLGAKHYERFPEPQRYTNGCKLKTAKTRKGKIQFQVPQFRQDHFCPNTLEEGM